MGRYACIVYIQYNREGMTDSDRDTDVKYNGERNFTAAYKFYLYTYIMQLSVP